MTTYAQQIAERDQQIAAAVQEAAAKECWQQESREVNQASKASCRQAARRIRSLDLDAIIASVPNHINDAVEMVQPEAAQDERAEDAYLIDRFSKLLAGVAIALRGPEEPLHQHSYADLPERAQVVALERDLLKVQVEELQAAKRDALTQARELTDAVRLDFITKAPSVWHVQWMQKPGKPVRYRMIEDGEPWGKWHASARAAIDEALLSASKGERS